MMADGSKWGIPHNQSVWIINKVSKILTCVHGDYNDPMSQAVRKVCPLIGYTTMHAPENMTQEQVQQAMKPVTLGADVYGTGKSDVSVTEHKPLKKYLWREITPEDIATFTRNLAKLPKRMRWKGKPTPQCDFCADDKPIVVYGATRMTTGQEVDCWRWLACAKCHEYITQNDFKSIERRSASALCRGDDQHGQFIVKMTLMAFHSDVHPA